MSTPSSVSDDLLLLEGIDDFREQALALAGTAVESLDILSRDLDFPIYDQAPFVEEVSRLARRSRYARVRILVKDTRPLIERGHALARLAQRLPSKIGLRKLVIEPDDQDMGFLICDRHGLLYKNDDSEHKGFVNFSAAAEVRKLSDIYEHIWQHGKPEPRLRLLKL